MLDDLRRPVVAGNQNVGKRLVVAQLHIEARTKLLDEVGFQQQRFGLGRRGDHLHTDGRRDHARDARHLACGTRIGREPLLHALGLADIEHIVGRIEHAIDAGRGRSEFHRTLDRGAADRERGFAGELGGLVVLFRKPCFFIVLGDGDRCRIDILPPQVSRRWFLRKQSRCRRIGRLCGIGGVVNHDQNL